MEKVILFWHWLSTSRYTRAVENENLRLFLENDELKASNKRLMAAIMPTLKAAITGEEPVVQKAADSILEHGAQPLKVKRVGWSTNRQILERDHAAEHSARVVETNLAVPGV